MWGYVGTFLCPRDALRVAGDHLRSRGRHPLTTTARQLLLRGSVAGTPWDKWELSAIFPARASPSNLPDPLPLPFAVVRAACRVATAAVPDPGPHGTDAASSTPAHAGGAGGPSEHGPHGGPGTSWPHTERALAIPATAQRPPASLARFPALERVVAQLPDSAAVPSAAGGEDASAPPPSVPATGLAVGLLATPDVPPVVLEWAVSRAVRLHSVKRAYLIAHQFGSFAAVGALEADFCARARRHLVSSGSPRRADIARALTALRRELGRDALPYAAAGGQTALALRCLRLAAPPGAPVSLVEEAEAEAAARAAGAVAAPRRSGCRHRSLLSVWSSSADAKRLFIAVTDAVRAAAMAGKSGPLSLLLPLLRFCSTANVDVGLETPHLIRQLAAAGRPGMLGTVLRHHTMSKRVTPSDVSAAMEAAARAGHVRTVRLLLDEFGADPRMHSCAAVRHAVAHRSVPLLSALAHHPALRPHLRSVAALPEPAAVPAAPPCAAVLQPVAALLARLRALPPGGAAAATGSTGVAAASSAGTDRAAPAAVATSAVSGTNGGWSALKQEGAWTTVASAPAPASGGWSVVKPKGGAQNSAAGAGAGAGSDGWSDMKAHAGQSAPTKLPATGAGVSADNTTTSGQAAPPQANGVGEDQPDTCPAVAALLDGDATAAARAVEAECEAAAAHVRGQGVLADGVAAVLAEEQALEAADQQSAEEKVQALRRTAPVEVACEADGEDGWHEALMATVQRKDEEWLALLLRLRAFQSWSVDAAALQAIYEAWIPGVRALFSLAAPTVHQPDHIALPLALAAVDNVLDMVTTICGDPAPADRPPIAFSTVDDAASFAGQLGQDDTIPFLTEFAEKLRVNLPGRGKAKGGKGRGKPAR